MRIISKYKDYYDFYTGIFGIDNNKVYDRREIIELDRTNFSYRSDYGILTFAICGTLYTMYVFKGVLYHTPEEMEILDNELLKNGHKYGGLNIQFWRRDLKKNETKFEKEYSLTNNVPTDINVERRDPVLVNISNWGYGRKKLDPKDFSVPLLESFEFYKILDPKEIYIQISTFLGWLVDNPPLPDTQTNIGKIEGRGFDKKTSFRPNMK